MAALRFRHPASWIPNHRESVLVTENNHKVKHTAHITGKKKTKLPWILFHSLGFSCHWSSKGVQPQHYALRNPFLPVGAGAPRTQSKTQAHITFRGSLLCPSWGLRLSRNRHLTVFFAWPGCEFFLSCLPLSPRHLWRMSDWCSGPQSPVIRMQKDTCKSLHNSHWLLAEPNPSSSEINETVAVLEFWARGFKVCGCQSYSHRSPGNLLEMFRLLSRFSESET